MTRWLLLLFITFAFAQDKDFPRKSPLEKKKLKKALIGNFELPESVRAVDVPETRTAMIGKSEIVFVDVDGNGLFGDPGIDGWTVAGQKHMVPVEEMLVIGTDEVRLKFEEDAVRYRLEPIKAKKEYLDALVKLNDLRLRNGLEPATIDAKLSDGCEKHCAYMAKNGIGHAEDKSKPGYTPEGDAAGRASCVNPGACVESVAVFYDTFYHRLPLMNPDTTAFGLGSNGTFTAMDGMRAQKKRKWKHPTVIPAPDTEGHPSIFNASGENPQPYPNGAHPGCPITVDFPWGKKPAVLSAEVREGGPKGKPLDLFVSSPVKPANPEVADNSNAICLMTKKPLRPKCAYHVKIVYTLDDATVELEWDFTTGT